jgi:hypothetical protein
MVDAIAERCTINGQKCASHFYGGGNAAAMLRQIWLACVAAWPDATAQ